MEVWFPSFGDFVGEPAINLPGWFPPIPAFSALPTLRGQGRRRAARSFMVSQRSSKASKRLESWKHRQGKW